MIGPKKLETKRLELCPFNKENFNEFFETINNEYCMNYLNKRSESSLLEKAKALFSLIISSHNNPNSHVVLKILNKGTNEYMGTCGLLLLNENTAIECFYALLPFYQGNGYAIEAMLKLLEFSFNNINIPKIIIFLSPDNSKAWKVAERIGMKYMGHSSHKFIIPKAMLFTIEKTEYSSQSKYF